MSRIIYKKVLKYNFRLLNRAQLIVCIVIGLIFVDWTLESSPENQQNYRLILKMFSDRKHCLYSIHQIGECFFLQLVLFMVGYSYFSCTACKNEQST